MVILVDHPDVDHPDVASEVPHCLGAVDAIRAKVQTRKHLATALARSTARPLSTARSQTQPYESQVMRRHDFCVATTSAAPPKAENIG